MPAWQVVIHNLRHFPVGCLRRMVAIELKLGEFKASYKGQMELYLAWLNRHERAPSEEKPIGLILCAGKKSETVELLDME